MPYNKLSYTQRGFSLIEAVLYVALLGGISVLIINFAVYTLGVHRRAWSERELVVNGRLAVDTLKRAISEAQSIYGPTSIFDSDMGQVSLVYATSTPTHTTGYADFWLDNGRLWTRKEGSGELVLSSPAVRIVKFRLERITQAYRREAVRITIQLDSIGTYPSSVTLNTTSVLRGGY